MKDEVTVRKGERGQPIIEQVGEASSYGRGFRERRLPPAKNLTKMIYAAYLDPTYGTQATVTNLKTGDSVDVKINDRGPYVKGRDIDLSKRAAKELGITKEGVAAVKIEAEIAPADKSKERNSRDRPKRASARFPKRIPFERLLWRAAHR